MLPELNGDEVRVLVATHRYVAVHIDAKWDGHRHRVAASMEATAAPGESQTGFASVDCDREQDYARSLELMSIPAVAYYRDGELVAVVADDEQDVAANLAAVRCGRSPL